MSTSHRPICRTGPTMLGFLHSCWRIALACTIRILRLPLIRKRIRNGDVILLTRDEHARGSWLLDLEEALSARDVATSTLSLSAFTGVLALPRKSRVRRRASRRRQGRASDDSCMRAPRHSCRQWIVCILYWHKQDASL